MKSQEDSRLLKFPLLNEIKKALSPFEIISGLIEMEAWGTVDCRCNKCVSEQHGSKAFEQRKTGMKRQ